ncbi:hypothetical protein GCM10010174_34970 [Kutzneria viridogrisea]|uniref:Uncharacterized protein n=1 Tax=Kutzneria viridogrisea TaxID=47990 RepID=A0ABR6BLF6_9PSEU|nr:hypothetical protein [Kutzneria viridogrisea]
MAIGFGNQRAVQRYAAFVGAMDMLGEAFRTVDRVIDRVDDSVGEGGYTLPTQDELRALRTTAFDALDALRAKGKKHEADLVSRPWAV